MQDSNYLTKDKIRHVLAFQEHFPIAERSKATRSKEIFLVLIQSKYLDFKHKSRFSRIRLQKFP